jgi:sentrin-specific protease 1
MHWCLAVIFVKEKKIQYYDSMSGSGRQILNNLLEYLKDEHLKKKETPLDHSEWTLVTSTSDTPQQHNGCDCGVFSCIAADHIANGEGLTYDQSDMPYFRQRIAARIRQGKLEPDINQE